ncbi:IMP dehydrogenase [Ichthyobacterium seriolicida]|uniref:Inosine-5'-monophosphate dehydrogenase n=1 Tax=Ichthyobacterium seriolicida TaxID=242600 RepID=A0A1J1E382_9FLAO|nr:inosine-5'-monophosphate dehydrogenase [Ichthyobacterium seriolicida]
MSAISENDKKILREGLAYDDVLMIPAYSDILPSEVNTETYFTKNVKLNIPIVSAAMDTVTESSMAISIAREGGIGVLHKNMSIEDQAEKVRKVKRSESGMILDPITLEKNAIVGDAKKLMKEYNIGGIPIVEKDMTLIGIVTNRDLRFESDMNCPITKVMTSENIITTQENTSLKKAGSILEKYKIEKLPVVSESGKLKGLITFRDIDKLEVNPLASKDKYGRLLVAAAVGVTEDVLDRVTALRNAGVDVCVIDTAHGHTKGVASVLDQVKTKFPDMDVIVGNVATAEGARYLLELGADAIKVGIGPGSICTTRVVSGVGYPQLSAIMEVANALKGTGVPVIGDGGIRHTGDITKAIAAGADTVMLGSLLAGTNESPGQTTIYEGRKYKIYRGMGSLEAMRDGSKDRYFQAFEYDNKKLVPEGIVGRVPYKGALRETIHQFIGGLRAGMGYCGARCISDLKNAKFVKITPSGLHESHPHNVTITAESPNYFR